MGETSQDGGLSPLVFSYDKDVPIFEDPESLASVERKIRLKECVLPDLDKMADCEAYIRMAVANARVSVFGSSLFLLCLFVIFLTLDRLWRRTIITLLRWRNVWPIFWTRKRSRIIC